MPDGSVHVIVDLGNRPGAVVQGAANRATTVRFGGVLEQVGVRLRPGAVAAVLGVPAAELEGRAVGSRTSGATPRGGSSSASRPIRSKRARCGSSTRSNAALRERDAAVDRAARAAADAIVRRRGAVRVRDLAGELAIGERRLEQIFRRDVGLSPRSAARVARFRAAVDHARRHTPSNRGLSSLARAATRIRRTSCASSAPSAGPLPKPWPVSGSFNPRRCRPAREHAPGPAVAGNERSRHRA